MVTKKKLYELLDTLNPVGTDEGDRIDALAFARGMVEEMLIGLDSNPVQMMVEKLGDVPTGRKGYIAQTSEVVDILSNLSPLISWNVFGENVEHNMIRIELRTSFHLDRSDPTI